jgi:NAD(P)-dependent dehydrogenase (short-subunit alcohol dehydrogenase family)
MPTVFFLTGSSRGLGRAIAEAVLAAGHQLAATARRPSSLDDLVAAHPERVLPVALDVADAEQARAAVAAGVQRFGRIDVVVNNAGYANLAAIEDIAPDDFRAQIDTNLFGVVNVTRAALPVLREQGSGHVIQVSSVGGRLATPGLSAYQSAKWAVGGFSSVLAAEVAPLGIKVTVLEPGGMQTDWARLVDAGRAGVRALPRHRRRDGDDAQQQREPQPRRSGEGGPGGAAGRRDGRSTAAAAAR